MGSLCCSAGPLIYRMAALHTKGNNILASVRAGAKNDPAGRGTMGF